MVPVDGEDGRKGPKTALLHDRQYQIIKAVSAEVAVQVSIDQGTPASDPFLLFIGEAQVVPEGIPGFFFQKPALLSRSDREENLQLMFDIFHVGPVSFRRPGAHALLLSDRSPYPIARVHNR